MEWLSEVVERFDATMTKTAPMDRQITINHLELAALIIGVGVVIA